MWAWTAAFIAFGRDHAKLEEKGAISNEAYAKYACWETLARLSGFRFMHEEFCIVSELPIVFKVNQNNQGHCEDGPYIQWADGTAFYSWHGTRAPAKWFHGDLPSAADALRWENVEQRRVACEMIGWHKILDELNAQSIDKDANPEIGELVEVTIPDIGREKFLRVRCGTGRDFALPVPPEMQTALQSQAWINNVPEHIIQSLEIRT